MKKKRKQPQQTSFKMKEKEHTTLKDLMNQDLVEKLKNTKQQLEKNEEKRKLEEEKRKKEEARIREKNKSFEELLNESSLKWDEFK